MKAIDIANALNDLDYDMIEEAERKIDMKKELFRSKKKGILIVAALVLLLCGTIA